MVEPVRHRQTKEAGTDMFEPKATAPHLDSTDLNLRNLSRTEPNVSLALHDTNHIGGRRRRVALATAIATRRYKDGTENVLGSWTFELSSLSRSRNGSSEGLDEKSVRLPKSANPAVMESIVALGRASFWASV
jgi:hypothetical protein